MHGLFIARHPATWSAVAGAFIVQGHFDAIQSAPLATGKALLPVIIATAACLISPWPLEDGSALAANSELPACQSLTFGVSEFRPTLGIKHIR